MKQKRKEINDEDLNEEEEKGNQWWGFKWRRRVRKHYLWNKYKRRVVQKSLAWGWGGGGGLGTGVSRRKLRNETASNSWENLTKLSGFPGCKIADFRYISPLNYGFSMLFGSSPTQETFPLVRYFQRKIFRRLKPIIRQNNPMPSEKVFHVYGVFRRLVRQHSNRSVLTPI